MTPHERFRLTLAHRLADRPPIDFIWPRPETMAALQRHFEADSREEVFRRLGVDFRWIPVPASYPDFQKKINGRLEGDAPGAGNAYFFHDARTFEDQWGVVFRLGDDGKYLQWRGGPLCGKAALEGWDTPAVSYPPRERISEALDPYRAYVTVTEIEFPFKLAWHLCGMEDLLMNMVAQPDLVEELYDRLYAFQTEKAVLGAAAGFDIIAVVGDVAGQEGMIFSPALFDRYDAPRLARLISYVKRANPETRVLYHSDGNMEAVIPTLIRCGIDILNPIQSACMDPVAVKRKYGDRLTLHGTISVQDTIPCGSVDDVRNEVMTRIRTIGYDGGFIVSPENSIPYDAPLENVLALFQTAAESDCTSFNEKLEGSDPANCRRA
jgi:uroporphyrinogen decarboxylase